MVYIKSYCKGLRIDEFLIHSAYETWLCGEAGKKNRWRVCEEYGTESALISEIASEIKSRSLSFVPIRRYRHIEPTNGKLRVIGIESIKQQTCDYLAVTALAPLLDAKVGYWQTASVVGKGQLMLVGACQRYLQDSKYHVHVDVRKCYPSIKTDVVKSILRKYVKSADVLYLCDTLLDSYDGCLEIGSYFSLRMAQLVLSFGYHFLEDAHKTRRGRSVRLIEHQCWYADDLFIFGSCKRDLELAVRTLGTYFEEGYGLEFKGWKVSRSGDQEPCAALSNSVRPSRVTIKPDLYLRIRKAYRDYDRKPTLRGAKRVCAYWGYLEHSDSHKARLKNGYDSTVRHARRHVSAHAHADSTRKERWTHERSENDLCHPARGREHRA